MIGSQDGYALVTGASSGIGYELAKLFAKDGKNVVILARSQDKLEDLKAEIESKYGTNVRMLVKDLSDSHSPQQIVSELENDGVKVDVLVNNAGFTVWGMFSETDWQKEAEMIQVNITSLTHLTKLYVKKMLEQGSGRILNVASLVGFMPAPLESIYCASKSYVLNFSEALANELKGTPVGVTCLCPGLTETLFYSRANMENCRAARMKMMDSATAAKCGYTALAKGKLIAIPGLQNRLIVVLVRILPRGVTTSIGRKLLEPL
jgi:short-subunit dehydrogenase